MEYMVKNRAISMTCGLALAILQALGTNANLQAQQQPPVFSFALEGPEKTEKCHQQTADLLELIYNNTDKDLSNVKVPADDDKYATCIAINLSNTTRKRYTIIKGIDGVYRLIKDLRYYS